MLTFRINSWDTEYEPLHMSFNGGEEHVRINDKLSYPVNPDTITITAQLHVSTDVMALLMLKDALDRYFPTAKAFTLNLGYVPYARQDRVCNKGESLAIKVFCDLINGMNFNAVYIADPHSDVTPALINNVQVLEQHYLIQRIGCNVAGFDAIIAPDAGATKKALETGKIFNKPVIQGVKVRDTSTGALTGFDVFGDVEGKQVLIVDDICDGGGTFVGLAKVLKERGATTVALYVTHGIFSQGISKLLDNGIDLVYTTNTFNHGQDRTRLITKSWR